MRTAERAMQILKEWDFTTLDITGGAPEMSSVYRYLIDTAASMDKKIMTRSNLTIFNEDGYCLTNKWIKRGGVWYWLDGSGAMATGWKKINNEWYFFKADGEMVTGWVKYADEWYYLNTSNGFMESNAFVKGKDGWYYLNEDGTMAEKPEFTVEPDGLITAKEVHR